MTPAPKRRGGRAPRAGVRRYPSGQIVHADRRPVETEEEAKATALEARLRREWGPDQWLSLRGSPKAMREARKRLDEPLLGYALGRLLLIGRTDMSQGITQQQHDAGSYFIWLYRANAKFRGWPSPNVRAIDYGASAPGQSVHPEDSEEWIADMRRKWGDMYRALYDLNVGEVYEVLKRVLIEDLHPESQAAIGALRMGLNAINRARGHENN